MRTDLVEADLLCHGKGRRGDTQGVLAVPVDRACTSGYREDTRRCREAPTSPASSSRSRRCSRASSPWPRYQTCCDRNDSASAARLRVSHVDSASRASRAPARAGRRRRDGVREPSGRADRGRSVVLGPESERVLEERGRRSVAVQRERALACIAEREPRLVQRARRRFAPGGSSKLERRAPVMSEHLRVVLGPPEALDPLGDVAVLLRRSARGICP